MFAVIFSLITPPKFKSLPLKIDGWKTFSCLLMGSFVTFQGGKLAVTLQVGVFSALYITPFVMIVGAHLVSSYFVAYIYRARRLDRPLAIGGHS